MPVKHNRNYKNKRIGIKLLGSFALPSRNTGGGQPVVYALLTEDLFNLLLEDGGQILLES